MSTVESVVQAFTATVGSGSVISQQVTFVEELKAKIEEISSAGGEIRNTLNGEAGIQILVKEYFEGFAGFLAQNEAPHDVQDGIVAKADELIEHTQSIDAVMETAINHILAGIEMFDSVNEICTKTVEEANELAGMISASAGTVG